MIIEAFNLVKVYGDRSVVNDVSFHVNKGEVVSYLDAASDNDLKYYESIENFTEWISKYVILEK